jgi:plastocyanin
MMRRWTLVSMGFVVALALWSCKGGQQQSQQTPSSQPSTTTAEKPPTPPAGPPPAPTDGTATIYGTVKFEGTPPKPEPINMGAELQCAALHPQPPTREDLVVNSNGTLRWTLVYVKTGLPSTYKPTVPSEPALLDQQGCVFTPHVAAVVAGQKVIFRNSDPVLHNTRGTSKNNGNFNYTQPQKGQESEHVFKNPELGIKVVCDVHPWMLGYIHVLPHPFFAVTGEDGSFTIKGLPPGKYTLEFVHEKLGTKTVELEAKANAVAQTEGVFKL